MALTATTTTWRVAPDTTAEPGFYENCDAARAAGAAPVRRGDPGCASHLDRDGDGVGCECVAAPGPRTRWPVGGSTGFTGG